MSEYTAEEIGRVARFTLKPKPAPQVPIAAQAPEPTPPTVKEPKPSDKLSEADGVDYLRTTGCMDDAEDFRIAAFLDACRDGYVTYGNVEEIVTNLKKPIVQTKPEPPAPKPVAAKPIAAKPIVVEHRERTTSESVTPQASPDPEAGLPILPDYVKRALGSNKLLTRQDIKRIPSQVYSDLYRGRYGDEFRKRVNAILNKIN